MLNTIRIHGRTNYENRNQISLCQPAQGLVTHGLVLIKFMPKAIHDKIDYENTMEVIDALAGHKLTDQQEL